jgi:hypothetical protein
LGTGAEGIGKRLLWFSKSLKARTILNVATTLAEGIHPTIQSHMENRKKGLESGYSSDVIER